MPFLCQECNHVHNISNLECFYINGKTIYLCKSHLHHRTPDMKHSPYVSDWSINGCTLCTVGQPCYGMTKPGIIVHGYGRDFCISRKQ